LDYDLNQFNFGKTIDNFYRPYIEMQKEYARELLTHRNPYTGKTYLEEPAIAFVEINNENSLLSNWRLLPELNREHRSALASQWQDWLKNQGIRKGNRDIFKIIGEYDDKTTPEQKKLLWSFLVETEMDYTKEMIGLRKG
jgi:hypothetical protein